MTELSPTATCSHLGHGGDDGGLVHQPVDRRVQQVCLCGPRAARQGGEVFTVRGASSEARAPRGAARTLPRKWSPASRPGASRSQARSCLA